MTVLLYVYIARCSDGQIKLIEGNSEENGRLEICSDKRWESLSGYYWEPNVARVACIELGFASTCTSKCVWITNTMCINIFRLQTGPLFYTGYRS